MLRSREAGRSNAKHLEPIEDLVGFYLVGTSNFHLRSIRKLTDPAATTNREL